MPLPKAGYGDFSDSDPLVLALRQALDYWMPGEAPADPRGRNVSEATRKAVDRLELPPVRIDLGASSPAQPPRQDPLAMGQPQPALPDGWTLQSLVADEVEPGSAMAPGVPVPARGMRPDLPERNPAFHAAPDEAFMAPELAGGDVMTTANILGMPEPMRDIGPEEAYLDSLGPIDRLRLDKELQNSRRWTPEEERANLEALGTDALSVLPVVGNAMSAEMGFSEGARALEALQAGDYGDAGVAGLLAALGGVGAVTGMPTGRMAGQAARGASSRSNAFVPVPPDDPMADTARLLYENAPRSWGARTSPDVRNANLAKETGTFFSPEGTLVREVPMAGRRLAERRYAAGDVLPLEEVLEYPALYRSMPEIADTPVSFIAERSKATSAPIARTTDEGFELSADMRANQRSNQLEKLIQYQIAAKSGMAGSFRDSLNNKIDDINRAIADAQLAMQTGEISEAAAQTYIRTLRGELNMMDTAMALSRSAPEKSPVLAERGFTGGRFPTPNDVRGAVKEDLTLRGSGNNMARAAMARLHSRGDKYPIKPGEREMFPGARGPMNFIAPMGDQVVIPQEGMDPLQVALMIENWRRFGGGQGK